jgi:glycosyltransferase involved in cell wall biosynthesis
LENVTILGPKPRSEQITFLNACDVAIVTLVDKMLGVSMPSRTYNVMAAGKPILAITENGSELSQVVNEDDIGWVVSPNSPKALHEIILAICNSQYSLEAMANRARSAALSRYSVDLALKRYKETLINRL